jgi:tetratricopeptide (TPR) repeat protein
VFTLPVAGLEFIDRIRALTPSSLVIVADKGARRLDEVAREDMPMIARHGSISMNVNLHALAWWNEHTGGTSLSSWHPGEGLDTVFLARGVRPQALQRAFDRWADLDAGTYGTLWEMASAKTPSNVGEALSLLRLCGHEPSGFELVVDMLEEAILSGEIDAVTIVGVLKRVEATSYLPGPYDVDFDMGRLAYAIEDWELAVHYFGRSADALPTSTPSWTNLAAAAFQYGDMETAHSAVIQAVAFDPEDNDALEVYSWFEDE